VDRLFLQFTSLGKKSKLFIKQDCLGILKLNTQKSDVKISERNINTIK